jgi:RNA 2',3'-cyclic 3'-phosphodiesterase
MRAFLALEIPQDIITYIITVIDKLAKTTRDVKWVRREGIHITVKFFGDIEEKLGTDMKDVIAPIGSRFTPIQARLGQLDAFPTRRSARVIVAKLSQGTDDMKAFFGEIEEGLLGLNVDKEKRELVPHITLGRRREPRAFPNGDPLPLEEKVFTVENLVLYKSTLTPGGAIYDPIWKIKLGG